MTGSPTPEDWALAQAIKLKDYPVEELEFARKTHAALARNGICTVGDLVIKTEEELMESPGIHRGALIDIKEVLSWDGLSLGLKLPDESA